MLYAMLGDFYSRGRRIIIVCLCGCISTIKYGSSDNSREVRATVFHRSNESVFTHLLTNYTLHKSTSRLIKSAMIHKRTFSTIGIPTSTLYSRYLIGSSLASSVLNHALTSGNFAETSAITSSHLNGKSTFVFQKYLLNNISSIVHTKLQTIASTPLRENISMNVDFTQNTISTYVINITSQLFTSSSPLNVNKSHATTTIFPSFPLKYFTLSKKDLSTVLLPTTSQENLETFVNKTSTSYTDTLSNLPSLFIRNSKNLANRTIHNYTHAETLTFTKNILTSRIGFQSFNWSRMTSTRLITQNTTHSSALFSESAIIFVQNNFTVNCAVYNLTDTINGTKYNLTWKELCKPKGKELPWYEDPKLYMIGSACVIGLILMGILKAVCSYCSKYSSEYLPPRHKLPRKRKDKESWVLRHIDYAEPIIDVPPPNRT